MSWNRQHRPTKLSDLHLIKVREQLQHLVTSKKIPQALLFAGPKGTGKTSSSRILGALLNDPQNATVATQVFLNGEASKAVFKDPDTDNPIVQKILSGNSFIVHEMDAASHRGIDSIRELTDRVSLPPQDGIVSVYILDEAHMLTTEAFNALLKVLEEPPAHVLFILATTELQKIPATIVSRCHTIPFYKATDTEMSAAVQALLNKEKITSTPDALAAIVAAADGSFRDAVKFAEQSVNGTQLDPTILQLVSSTALDQHATTYLEAVLEKNPQKIIQLFATLRETAVPQKQFHTTLVSKLHKAVLLHYTKPDQSQVLSHAVALFLLKELQDTQLSEPHMIPYLLLELKSLEIIDRATNKKPPAQTSGPSNPSTPTKSVIVPKAPTKSPAVEPKRSESKPVSIAQNVTISSDMPKGDGSLLVEKWQDFVDNVAEKNSTVAALLRSAQPIKGEVGLISVSVFYKFHQEQLSEPTFAHKVHDFVTKLCGGYLDFDFQLAAAPAVAELRDAQHASSDLARLATETLM